MPSRGHVSRRLFGISLYRVQAVVMASRRLWHSILSGAVVRLNTSLYCLASALHDSSSLAVLSTSSHAQHTGHSAAIFCWPMRGVSLEPLQPYVSSAKAALLSSSTAGCTSLEVKPGLLDDLACLFHSIFMDGANQRKHANESRRPLLNFYLVSVSECTTL